MSSEQQPDATVPSGPQPGPGEPFSAWKYRVESRYGISLNGSAWLSFFRDLRDGGAAPPRPAVVTPIPDADEPDPDPAPARPAPATKRKTARR